MRRSLLTGDAPAYILLHMEGKGKGGPKIGPPGNIPTPFSLETESKTESDLTWRLK